MNSTLFSLVLTIVNVVIATSLFTKGFNGIAIWHAILATALAMTVVIDIIESDIN